MEKSENPQNIGMLNVRLNSLERILERRSLLELIVIHHQNLSKTTPFSVSGLKRYA